MISTIQCSYSQLLLPPKGCNFLHLKKSSFSYFLPLSTVFPALSSHYSLLVSQDFFVASYLFYFYFLLSF